MTKKEIIEGLKPIVYGEWIIDKHNRVAQCSVCNKISPYDYGDFCKWCGADMRKESEEKRMTCKDCKYCKECIMSYPDGNWKPCKDFELKKESEEEE